MGRMQNGFTWKKPKRETHEYFARRSLTQAGCDLRITKSPLLGGQQVVIGDAVEALSLEPLLSLMQLAKLRQEPGVDLGVLKDCFLGHAILHCLHSIIVIIIIITVWGVRLHCTFTAFEQSVAHIMQSTTRLISIFRVELHDFITALRITYV